MRESYGKSNGFLPQKDTGSVNSLIIPVLPKSVRIPITVYARDKIYGVVLARNIFKG